MSNYVKPLPLPDEETQEFWEAARRHELVVQRCDDCGEYRFPPRPLCAKCLSRRFAFAKVSGRGTLYSFIIVHHAYNPPFVPEIPYNVAAVALEEQDSIILTTNIVRCANEDLRVGMPVEAVFEDVAEEITLVKFAPRRRG